MNPKVKQYLVDNCGLAKDADEQSAKEKLAEVLKSGELDADKYTELLTPTKEADKTDRTGEFAQKIAQEVSQGVAEVMKGFMDRSEAQTKAPKETQPEPQPESQPVDLEKKLAEMEEKLAKKFDSQPTGGDGAKLMDFCNDDSEDMLRVKSVIERYEHTPTALTYKSGRAKLLKIHGQPMRYNGKDVNESTQRTKALSAAWFKMQVAPESLNEHDKDLIQWALHREKFHVPSTNMHKTEARLLTDQERDQVWDFNMNFYTRHKALVDDSSSGGEDSIPEFFDMDMIVAPTLADENIPSYCNVVPVPRGSSVQNFVMGRPTIGAANEATTVGSPTTVFSTTGFITNHDTDLFRAAGFIELGRNYVEDAHPGIMDEIRMQYMESVGLWFNEQIMAGDGTTEPQGVIVASNTTDVTPASPTTGSIVLTDVFDLLFGVGKAHRNKGGRGNAIYAMTDTTYQRIRRVATGVTGDTRLVFGEDVESYQLFGHPVLIEEQGLSNSDAVFFQAKGYRLYLRQGVRFIRADGGDTLTRRNSFLVGVDVRAGGQLDLGAYAAVIDAFPS